MGCLDRRRAHIGRGRGSRRDWPWVWLHRRHRRRRRGRNHRGLSVERPFSYDGNRRLLGKHRGRIHRRRGIAGRVEAAIRRAALTPSRLRLTG